MSRKGLSARVFSAIIAAILLLAPAAAFAGKKKDQNPAPAREFVWPAPPDEPRIKYLRSLRTDHDFEKKKKKSRWKRLLLGPQKDKVIGLQKPYGVATDSQGRVYVTDSGLASVMVFDLAAREVKIFSHASQVKFHTPIGIAVDGDDRIFVSDVGLHQVLCITGDGELLLAFGRREGLVRPAGLAIDKSRRLLYVSDTPQHRIFVYGLDGKLIRSFGERGTGEGQFNYPTNLAIDSTGRLHVVDTGNFRVQTLSPDGEFLSTFGGAGSGFGQFTRPKGIAIDSEGHLYVADAAFNNFQIFDDKGQLLMFVGGYGNGPGGFWLPAGVHVDSSDRVYVADQVNMRVQVFQYMPSSSPEEGRDPVTGDGPAAEPGGNGLGR